MKITTKSKATICEDYIKELIDNHLFAELGNYNQGSLEIKFIKNKGKLEIDVEWQSEEII